ncbi:hypothetical protein ACU8V3_15350 [Cobetia marina]
MKMPYKNTKHFDHVEAQPERFFPRDPGSTGRLGRIQQGRPDSSVILEEKREARSEKREERREKERKEERGKRSDLSYRYPAEKRPAQVSSLDGAFVISGCASDHVTVWRKDNP